MQYKKVFSDQFKWIEDWLVHIPTGARFKWSYPNSTSNAVACNWGDAGNVLPNGDDYELDEIERMASVLLEAQKEKR